MLFKMPYPTAQAPRPLYKLNDVANVLNWCYKGYFTPNPTKDELITLSRLIWGTWVNIQGMADVNICANIHAFVKFRKLVRGCYLYAQGNHRIIYHNPDTNIYIIGSTSEREKPQRREHIVILEEKDGVFIVLDSRPDEDLHDKLFDPFKRSSYKPPGEKTEYRLIDFTKHMTHAVLVAFKEVYGKENLLVSESEETW
jgi:hypothetical protein